MGLYVEVNLARNLDDDLHELELRRQYDAVIDEANEQQAGDWERALLLLDDAAGVLRSNGYISLPLDIHNFLVDQDGADN